MAFVVVAFTANADHLGVRFNSKSVLDQIEYNTKLLEENVDNIYGPQRTQAKLRVDRLIQELSFVSEELSKPSAGWYQADGQECVNFCRNQGMRSGLSPEGAQCTSGETQVNSAVGLIVYSYGTWGSVEANVPARSNGGYCYKGGQKKDNDRTDITVGCFCEQ